MQRVQRVEEQALFVVVHLSTWPHNLERQPVLCVAPEVSVLLSQQDVDFDHHFRADRPLQFQLLRHLADLFVALLISYLSLLAPPHGSLRLLAFLARIHLVQVVQHEARRHASPRVGEVRRRVVHRERRIARRDTFQEAEGARAYRQRARREVHLLVRRLFVETRVGLKQPHEEVRAGLVVLTSNHVIDTEDIVFMLDLNRQ